MDKETYILRLKNAMTGEYDDEYIEQCVKYSSALLDKNLPVIFDAQHLNEILRLSSIKMDYYQEFEITGKKGKVRTICAPSRSIKVRQRWILDNILSRVHVAECCEGFLRGHSICTNARKHMGFCQSLNVDLQDFFPSISQERIVEVFVGIGYSTDAAVCLAMLCCHNGMLPQGAPTSPYLANIVCRKMDEQLMELAKEHKLVYTRYADDMTFSGNVELSALQGKIREIIYGNGFQLNEKKTRIKNANQRRIITGVIVKEGSMAVPRDYKRKLRQEIYYCKKYGVANHLENSKAKKKINFKEYLYGKAYYIKMVEPKTGEKFLKELNEINWD